MNHQEALKSMLQDVINDRMENASVTMHDYFVSKTREVTGLAGQQHQEDLETVDEAVVTEGMSEADLLKKLGHTMDELKAMPRAKVKAMLVKASEEDSEAIQAVMKLGAKLK